MCVCVCVSVCVCVHVYFTLTTCELATFSHVRDKRVEG